MNKQKKEWSGTEIATLRSAMRQSLTTFLPLRLAEAAIGGTGQLCQYFSDSGNLSCAVHPSHLHDGLCNENCPDFKLR